MSALGVILLLALVLAICIHLHWAAWVTDRRVERESKLFRWRARLQSEERAYRSRIRMEVR